MKVLITGATGLLGGHLLQELQQRGEQIRVLVLPVENAEKLIAQGVEVVRGDVTDASTLAPAVRDIEIIFHLAGMMGVDRPLADYRLVNVTGSENLYRAAQAAGVRRFVHTSSHTVYGLGYGRFLTEEDALRPDPDPYSITKAEGDHLLRRLMLRSDVETVMQGFLLAAYHEKAPGNVYNISNDHPLTQQDIFNAIADNVGGKRPTRHLPYLPIYYGGIVAEKVAFITHTKPIVTRLGAMMFGTDNRHSVEKARRELGYEPKVDIREGIRLAAAWFNAGGMEQPFVTQASQYASLAGVRKS